MSRRDLLAAAASAAFAAGTGKPNILFILADDLGYADLSCYGRRDYQTPVLDKMAAEGVRFTQAYSNSPVCSATRTALMTGRYQYRIPVGLEEPIAGPYRNTGLPPAHPTLPGLLRGAGYRTSLVGKWHLGYLPTYGPLKSGYGHFWGFRGSAVDYYTHQAGDGGPNPNDLWDGDHRVEETGYLTDLLGDKAIAEVQEAARRKQPLFLSLHFSAPHWPWQAAPGEQQANELGQGSLATYASMVRRMDFQIGRLLEAVEAAQMTRNTLVVFTSDNGGERYSDTWPFTGKKAELLEGGLRVPAIARWPGKLPQGVTSEQVLITMDWLPTLLAFAGAKPDPAYPPDGKDLSAVIAGEAPTVARKLFWRHRFNGQRAMRDGNRKWLRIRNNEFLFDLAADPLERANRRYREADAWRRMRNEYIAWNATMLPEDPQATSYALFGDQLADHFGNDRENQ